MNLLKYFNESNSFKHSFAIYPDFEILLVKIDGYDNNPHKSFTTKVSKHKPCGQSNMLL